MAINEDLSAFKVVRLNCELFPPSEFELEKYAEAKISPVLVEADDPDQILAVAADCDVLVVVSTALPATVIDGLAKCRMIARVGAGTDKIDVQRATEKGIVVANVYDFCIHEQAEHALALLLAVVRKLPQMADAMRDGAWTSSRSECSSIHRMQGKTLGLVGFGGSAKQLARRVAGFDFRILANRRNMDAPDDEALALGVEMVDLEALLAESDYVSLHLPLNTHTRYLFDEARLRSMKPGAVLINTARGAIVDESALVHVLEGGHLSGAGIDTFHEINVHGGTDGKQDHPLLHLPNVVLTPHVAAYSVEARKDVGYGTGDNVIAALRGELPRADRIVNADVEPRYR